MDDKYRHIVQLHRPFLVKNIVWTDFLVESLRDEHLMPDSVLKESQEKKTREEKVGCVLDILPVRGVLNSYSKFCDVLQKCGHAFVADFLRDEGNIDMENDFEVLEDHDWDGKLERMKRQREEKENVDVLATKFDTREMYKKLPFLNNLKAQEQTDLQKFFVDKLRTEALKLVWKDDVRDKEKAIEARRLLIEQHADYRNEVLKLQEKMKALEKQLEDSKMEVKGLNAQVKVLENNLRESAQKHAGDVGMQLRFNQANENQLQKAKEKVNLAEATLRGIQEKLNEALQSRPRKLTQKQEIEMHINEFAFLPEDVDRLLEKHEDLKKIGLKYFELCEERDYILTHMGHDANSREAPSLLDAYREFAVKTEETMTELRGKIAEYGEMVESQTKKEEDKKKAFQMGANVWQAAIMNVMRNQLQDVKLENRKKDTKIQLYENDSSKMKAKIQELEEEIKKLKRTRSKETKTSLISVDNMNGCLSMSSNRSDHSDELDDDYNRKSKEPLLPPLHKHTMSFPNPPSYSVQMTSPRKNNHAPRQLGQPGNKYSNSNPTTFPEGLSTAPVVLEKKNTNKYLTRTSHHGLGDLKAMNARNKFEKSLNTGKVWN